MPVVIEAFMSHIKASHKHQRKHTALHNYEADSEQIINLRSCRRQQKYKQIANKSAYTTSSSYSRAIQNFGATLFSITQ